jgi:hypothetical protein
MDKKRKTFLLLASFYDSDFWFELEGIQTFIFGLCYTPSSGSFNFC